MIKNVVVGLTSILGAQMIYALASSGPSTWAALGGLFLGIGACRLGSYIADI